MYLTYITYTGTRKVDLDTLGHSKVKVHHLYLVLIVCTFLVYMRNDAPLFFSNIKISYLAKWLNNANVSADLKKLSPEFLQLLKKVTYCIT